MTEIPTMSRLEALLCEDEAFRQFAYDDASGKTVKAPQGNLTIGVGRNLQARGLSAAEAMFLLRNDIAIADADLRKVFGDVFIRGLQETQPARYAVLLSMAFNLGIDRLKGFRNMIRRVSETGWAQAASEMEASLWARQVGRRAVRLTRMMRSGEWE